MLKRAALAVVGVVVATMAVAGVSPAAAQTADEPKEQCQVWLPYIQRDLALRRAVTGEFPRVWTGLLPDGRGNTVIVPFTYEFISEDKVVLTPDPEQCEGDPDSAPLGISYFGDQVDDLNFDGLLEGPYSTPPTIPPPTTVPSTTVPPATAPPTTAPPEVLGGTQTPGCDPNYEGACVPIAPANSLNCADVDGTNFRVVGVDIHRLDEGGVVGIACESGAAAVSTSTGTSGSSSRQLALTGPSKAEAAYRLAAVLLVTGFLLALAAAMVPPERLRGGFTITRVGRDGPTTTRVTSARTRRRR